jgi:hypothetical protein
VDAEQIEQIQAEIDELKKRWPRHSAPPILYKQMEELEERLIEAGGQLEEQPDGGH